MTIFAKLFSILTTGFRGEDVESFLHSYIRETGHAPGGYFFFDKSNSFKLFL